MSEKMTGYALLERINRTRTQLQLLAWSLDDRSGELKMLNAELARRDGSAARETPGASTGPRT